MPATPSQTAIANAAAALLGSTQRINAVSQSDVPLARHVRDVWDSMICAMLADHPWNFALERALLNASATAPLFGYDRAFSLPPQCLRWLPPSREDADWFEAVEEGGLLLTNAEAPLPVRFVSVTAAESVERWPAFFVTAVEYELAARVAEPLTQSSSVAKDMMDMAAAKLRLAKRRDGQASGNRRRTQITTGSDWLSARHRPYFPYRR
jgi:hypothetical protein